MSRLLVLLVLLLATALSGAAEAALQAVGPGSRVVICADGHAVVVTLAADGLPADPQDNRRHCPDCLPLPMAATDDAAPAWPLLPVAGHPGAARHTAFAPRAADQSALPSPRGPPGGTLA